jgi:YidC/Oxa1 family membrane protein insertase
MVYRPRAFDFYDSIFTVGPHHDLEIRSLENHNKSAAKKLISHGYGRLESLAEAAKNVKEPLSGNIAPTILIAPSWGRNALIERHGGDFIRPLLDAGYYIILRPHPETTKYSFGLLNKISNEYKYYENFRMEDEVASKDALLKADLMISDYSGVALEFALALQKPVLFVDVPKKINNPDYLVHHIEPLEVSIRDEIGKVISEEKLSDILIYVDGLLNKIHQTNKISLLRNKYIYNFGQSGQIAASALINIADCISE